MTSRSEQIEIAKEAFKASTELQSMPDKCAASELGVHRATISKWRRLYTNREGFNKERYRTAKRCYLGSEDLIVQSITNPGAVAKQLGVNVSSVYRWRKTVDICPELKRAEWEKALAKRGTQVRSVSAHHRARKPVRRVGPICDLLNAWKRPIGIDEYLLQIGD